MKKKVVLTVRLILEKEGQILMLKQTPRNGGGHTLVGGKIDAQEYAIEALIREAKEEVGIDLRENKLKLIHVVQFNKKETTEVLLLFRTKKWYGEIVGSQEPKKFTDALFVSPDNLPEKMPPLIRHLIKQYKKGRFYSEFVLAKVTS